MNHEKLKKLQEQVRIGGKGSARRKKKVVHQTAGTDDKKLQSSLKKLSVNLIPGIEEVNMIRNDGTIIHFNNPKTQASLSANTFAITGHSDVKQITELLPGILHQLGPNGLNQLKKLASNAAVSSKLFGSFSIAEEVDGVPQLIDNFDEIPQIEEYTETIDKNEIVTQIVEIENNETENRNSVTLAEIITPVKERTLMVATKECKIFPKLPQEKVIEPITLNESTSNKIIITQTDPTNSTKNEEDPEMNQISLAAATTTESIDTKNDDDDDDRSVMQKITIALETIELESGKLNNLPSTDIILDLVSESKNVTDSSKVVSMDESKIDKGLQESNGKSDKKDDSKEIAKITEMINSVGEVPTTIMDITNLNNSAIVITSTLVENESTPKFIQSSNDEEIHKNKNDVNPEDYKQH